MLTGNSGDIKDAEANSSNGVNNLTLAQRRAQGVSLLDALKGALLRAEGRADDWRVTWAQAEVPIGGDANFWVDPYNTSTEGKLDAAQNPYATVSASESSTFTYKNGRQKTVWRRRHEDLVALLAVVLDDVGTKSMDPERSNDPQGVDFFVEQLKPTFIVETSPNNSQIWYILRTPITDMHYAKDYLASVIGTLHKRHGIDKLADINRIMRVPFGVNSKVLGQEGGEREGQLKYPMADGKPWNVRLVDSDLTALYEPDDILQAFDITVERSAKARVPRLADNDTDGYKAAIYDKWASALLESRAAQDRGEGRLAFDCMWPHETGRQDGAMINTPNEKNHYQYTFHCSSATCTAAKAEDPSSRSFFAAAREAGVLTLEFDREWIAKEQLEPAAVWARDRVEQLKAGAEYAAANGWVWSEEPKTVRYYVDRRSLEAAVPQEIVEGGHEEPVEEPDASESSGEGVSGKESKKAKKPKKDAASAAAKGAQKSEWSEGWHYLASRDRVVRPGELTTYSKQGFDALFAQRGGVEGGKAFDYVRKNTGFTHADGMAYVAGAEPVFTFQGQTLVNEFIPSSIPKAAAEYSYDGLAAVETIRYHLALLSGEYNKPPSERLYAHMLESWIALNVRHPGKIIGIAPLIKGIQGDGKTVIFKTMMSALMGTANVKEASTKEVCSDFNSYAYGAAVRVIEELKMAGENRFAVADGVKPLITNHAVRVVAKRANGIDLPNATNYVALTNHPDAVPIDDSDRRWFIVFTPWDSIDELEAVVGSIRAYFTRLHNAIEEHAAALRKYFEECAIHDEIFHGMRAPITPWRGMVIEQEQAMIGGDFFDSYVQGGDEHGISKDIVATDMLTKAFARDIAKESAPKTRQVSRLLKAKGWHRVPGVVKIGGKTRILYVSDSRILDMGEEMRNSKLREMFFATMPDDYKNNPEFYDKAGGM